MRIAICDDDKAYVDEIVNTVQDLLGDKQIKADIDLYTDSEKLYNCNSFYDIAFLDIEMQNYSGIQIANKLKTVNPYIIIFIITYYDQYLDEAMDLNVFRYIKKPLDRQRLSQGLNKALEFIDNSAITFFLKRGNVSKNIFSNDIIVVETVGRATKVVTVNGEYLSENNMSFWQEKLIASFFYQVHKSFIINMKYITDYKRDIVVLKNKYKVPISYRKQSEFRSYFLNFF